MYGLRESTSDEMPDVVVQGRAMTITTARTYVLAKNMQAWGASVELHPWDTWDKLADRLEQRFEYHIWHPWHWQAVATTRAGKIL